jgi:hypothetical protein
MILLLFKLLLLEIRTGIQNDLPALEYSKK